LADAVQLVQASVNEMRSVLFPLSFDATPTPGLAATVQRVLQRFDPSSPMAVHISPLPDLSSAPTIEEAVVGIIGEALANAGKHASARNVWVEVTVDKDVVNCLIRDDGVGFDLRETKNQAHVRKTLGLYLIQERARLAGGDVTITSHPKSGTVVQARFPVRPSAKPLPTEAEPLHPGVETRPGPRDGGTVH
jgi:signal transduction histidine kinase